MKKTKKFVTSIQKIKAAMLKMGFSTEKMVVKAAATCDRPA